MLNIKDPYVREHLLDGNFGLEKESIRIKGDGSFSHSAHPFPDDKNIVKDFCESQTEINTGVHDSIRGAVDELYYHTVRIDKKLASLPEHEYLWLFSNPPYIKDENDIAIAKYEGAQSSKAEYREYLADKYGRYRMTFSGIHVNFSFSDDLIEASFKSQSGISSKKQYKDRLYLELARRLASYSWLLVSVTAASPVLDSSFFEKGICDNDVFTGMASVRCSEMGYWNDFAPILDYSGIDAYADSIQTYVDRGFLKAPSELYYPIRLKPPGENNLDNLRLNGVNHIELRMFDLNPLTRAGVDELDIAFAQLMMVWLASTPMQAFPDRDQVHAVQNFKNSAHYDLKTVKIITHDGQPLSMVDAAQNVIRFMHDFYKDLEMDVSGILDYEKAKFDDADNRYAWKIRKQFSGGFAKKALALAKERQKKNV